MKSCDLSQWLEDSKKFGELQERSSKEFWKHFNIEIVYIPWGNGGGWLEEAIAPRCNMLRHSTRSSYSG